MDAKWLRVGLVIVAVPGLTASALSAPVSPTAGGASGSAWTQRQASTHSVRAAAKPEQASRRRAPAHATRWYEAPRSSTYARPTGRAPAVPSRAVAHLAAWSRPSRTRQVLELSRVGAGARLRNLGTGRAVKSASLEGSLILNGNALDNTLVVDFSHGNPIPKHGLTFNGGGHVSTAGNVLLIRGGHFHRVVSNFVNAHDGSIELDGARIRYTGLQPVALGGPVSNLTLNLAAGAYTAFLEDDGTTGNNTSQLRSSTNAFETMTFVHPTSSLTINHNGSGQTVTVNPVDSFGSANLTINGVDSITMDQFQTTGTTTLDPTGQITESSPGALVTGSLLTEGAGPVTLDGSSNSIGTAASNTTGASNGFSLTDSVGLTVGTVGGVNGVTTSNGDVTLTADTMSLAKAVNAGAGVVELEPLTSGRVVDLGTNPSSGKLGLNQTDLNNVTAGVLRVGDLSNTGGVTVTAAISAPAGWTKLSLLTDVSGTVTQTAPVTVPGLNAAGGSGVTLTNAGNAVGTVAGASEGSWSFVDSSAATVGSVDSGLGFGFGVGIIDQAEPVLLTAPALTVNQPIDTTHSFGSPATAGANVTLTADNMALNNNSPTSTINAGTGGALQLAPATASNTIAVGGPDAAGQLGINDNDLANVTAGVVRLGNLSQTGALTVDGTITRHAGYSTLSLLAEGTGGAITQTTGSISVANLALRAVAGIGSTGAVQIVGPANLAFANTTSNNVQVTSTGAVTIAAVDGLTSASNSAVGGTTTLHAGSPLTFAVNTTSSGTLTATTIETASETGTPLPPPDDNLTVNSGVTVESTGGDVNLTSADGFTMQSTSVVKSDNGNITLVGGVGDVDSDAVWSLHGSLQAPHGTVKPQPPSASITLPPSGQTYAHFQPVATSFSCAEGLGGPGMASCDDSTGTNTVTGGSGHLDTSTIGFHTYTVTATSIDSLTASTSITYFVSPLNIPGATSTTTSLTSSKNPALVRQPVTFTATVSPVPDGGTVQFTDPGTTISGCGTVPVNTMTGKASCTATFTSAGSRQVQAIYSGSFMFTGSMSPVLAQAVRRAPTSTSLTSSPNPSLAGQRVAFTATVRPMPDGGTVAFFDDGHLTTCHNVAPNLQTGTAVCHGTFGAPGQHTITAVYSGDARFTRSRSRALIQVVKPKPRRRR